jgi:serine/threonine protein kinase
MTLEPGTKLGNYWRIGALLGEGACAKVYSVKSERENLGYEVVAKVIPTGNGSKSKKDKDQELLCDTLYFEHVLYTGLLVDFPYKAELPLYFSGVDNILKMRYLVMEKFEYDLTHLAKLKPSAAKVSSIGKQLLKGLQLLHSKGYLFIDVKPDNFMMKKDNVYFVDCKFSSLILTYYSFVLSIHSIFLVGLVERIGLNPPGTPRELNGTPTYCSISVHDGNQPSPKDDLEGLGYVLLYLLTGGSLPWNIAKTDAELLRIKKSTDIIQYAQSIGCREVSVC